MVALRQRLFRHREHASADELAEYFDEVFFRNPWADPDLTSLVYEDASGTVIGFLGVVPRLMTLGGERIRVAVGTQLMAAPGNAALAGVRLARAFIAGPQDLSLSDTANDAAQRVWESVGGTTAAAYRLTWTRALRPCRYALSQAAIAPPFRAALVVARPLCGALDAVLARLPRSAARRADPGDRPGACEPDVLAARAREVAGLAPLYEPEALAWLLARLAAKRHLGRLACVAVRDGSGDLIGWFMYFRNRGGVGQVVQVAALRGAYERVLARLCADAWNAGCTALAGRADPPLRPALERLGCRLQSDGPWVLVHARRHDLMDAIARGDALLSRLEGEWWLNF